MTKIVSLAPSGFNLYGITIEATHDFSGRQGVISRMSCSSMADENIEKIYKDVDYLVLAERSLYDLIKGKRWETSQYYKVHCINFEQSERDLVKLFQAMVENKVAVKGDDFNKELSNAVIEFQTKEIKSPQFLSLAALSCMFFSSHWIPSRRDYRQVMPWGVC